MARFQGIKIWDNTASFYTNVDTSHDVQKNIGEVKEQTTLGYSKPFATYFGNTNYYSGKCTGLFSNNTETDCIYDYNFDDVDYKYKVEAFLCNRKPKWLQLSDNLIIRVVIQSPIVYNCNKEIDSKETTITFSWFEVGNGEGGE